MGQRDRVGRSKLGLIAILGILSIATALSTATPAAASGIAVYVGYADSLRADATNFPTPWAGSPNTVFHGCAPVTACVYDAGAVRVVNNTATTITVNAIAVHVDACTFTGWQGADLAPGAGLIVTQMAATATDTCSGPDQMDTSDIGPGGSSYTGQCVPDGIQPTVDVTIDSVTTSYTDSGQVLNTGGFDAGVCTGNESIQWTLVGTGPCRGSVLSLSPSFQQHQVLATGTVTATFTNSCGQPLSDVAVGFAVLAGGVNAGLTGSGITDANGMASFSYSSAKPGTDPVQGSISNLAGQITSSAVTVKWTVDYASGGAFVIGDRGDGTGASVYWWGAQWWKKDHLSTGLAPASFKGYETGNASPWCGQTWTTRPGNSPHPPTTVPGMMAVIVSSHIVKNGPVISGDIVHIVIVQTKRGYGPNPGHPGTGTIVRTLC